MRQTIEGLCLPLLATVVLAASAPGQDLPRPHPLGEATAISSEKLGLFAPNIWELQNGDVLLAPMGGNVVLLDTALRLKQVVSEPPSPPSDIQVQLAKLSVARLFAFRGDSILIGRTGSPVFSLVTPSGTLGREVAFARPTDFSALLNRGSQRRDARGRLLYPLPLLPPRGAADRVWSIPPSC